MADREVLHRYYRGEIRGIDPENFTADVLISDGSVDRHGTVIEPTAWKKDIAHYRNHPILVASHNHYDLLSQIGEAVKLKFTKEGPEARFKWYVGEGNPQADWGWKLAEKGMAMFSVGFIPIDHEDLKEVEADEAERKKKDKTKVAWRKYTRVELAEVSQVVVGSNRNALQRMADLNKELEELEEMPRLSGDTHKDFSMVCEFAREILAEIEDIPEEEEMGIGDKVVENLANAVAESLDREIMEELEERPYPNHHACRLRNPGDFQKGKYVTMKRKHDGKEYNVIMGRLKGETDLTEQSYRYPKDVWTEKAAKSHCKGHKGILFEPATEKEAHFMEGVEVVEFPKVPDEKPMRFIWDPEEDEAGEVKEDDHGPKRDPVEEEEKEERKVVPFKKEGTASEGRPWDAGAARRRLASWAGGPDKEKISWSKYQRGFAFVVQGQEDVYGGYKFPHHDVIDGALQTVWKGCVACLVRLFGVAKNLSMAERKGIYNHVAKHYRQNFDKEPPEFKMFTQEEIADLFGLEEDEESSGSRKTPPEPVDDFVYDGLFTEEPGESDGEDTDLDAVIREIEEIKGKFERYPK